MKNLINKQNPDGTLKTVKELDDELKVLLISYRRQNNLLADQLFDLNQNTIPCKDNCILALKEEVKELKKKIIYLEVESKKKKGWFF